MFARKQNAAGHFQRNHLNNKPAREKKSEKRTEEVLQRGGVEYEPQKYVYPDCDNPDNKWRVVDFWLYPSRQDVTLFLESGMSNGKHDGYFHGCVLLTLPSCR